MAQLLALHFGLGSRTSRGEPSHETQTEQDIIERQYGSGTNVAQIKGCEASELSVG